MKLVSDLDLDVEFLPHLPFQALEVVLAILQLAAGELPVSPKVRAREPLRNESLVRPLDNRGDYYYPSWLLPNDRHGLLAGLLVLIERVGLANRAHRTDWALGPSSDAHQCAEVHQRLVEVEYVATRE